MSKIVCHCSQVMALTALMFLSLSAQAQMSTYIGSDPGAGPTSPRPNSDTAAAAFDAAVTSSRTLTFESSNAGTFTSLTPSGAGVTITHSNDTVGIDMGGTNIIGFNITPGGTKYLSVGEGVASSTMESLTFTFATPISAFGAYIVGLGTGNYGTSTLTFNDGMPQSLSVSGNTLGGVQFFGFTDPGASITSVSFVDVRPAGNISDVFGFDDVRYATAVVPEPSALALVAGVGGNYLVWLHRRRGVRAAQYCGEGGFVPDRVSGTLLGSMRSKSL